MEPKGCFFQGLSIKHIFDMECKNRNHLGDIFIYFDK